MHEETVANKKRKFKQKLADEMTKSQKSPKIFWKLLDKLSGKKKTSTYVSHNSIANYIKTLLNSNDQNVIPPESKEFGKLDFPITLEEVRKASGILQPGKAVGLDNLNNEMIFCLLDVNPAVLVKLFNKILNGGGILPEWVIAYIVPIHKSGAISEPSNYRGISLLSCLNKLFRSVLH